MLQDSAMTYIINLDKDDKKRTTILAELSGVIEPVEVVSAIYGPDLPAREYFRYVKNENPSFGGRHILTPAEVGCFLSHRKVLTRFIEESECEWLIVLEDDVSPLLPEIQSFGEMDLSSLSKTGLYILGGQDGLDCEERFLLSPFSQNSTNFRRVVPFTERWLFRTCCYLIHRYSAKSLLSLLNTSSFIVDDWRYIVRNTTIERIYYHKFFSHPIDLSGSEIERERNLIG